MRRSRPRATYREVAVTLPLLMAILLPLLILFNLVQRQSVEWQFLYTGATYALAALVALVLPWVNVWKGPQLGQLALGTALMTLFVFGLVFGSLIGLSALIEGLHVPNNSSDRSVVLLLMFVVWGAYQLVLLEWMRRRTQHLQRARNAP